MRTTLLIAVVIALGSCGDPAPVDTSALPADTTTVDPLANCRQLVGEWIDSTTSKDFTCYERWSVDGDSAIIGFGHVIAHGDTVFIEDLRISNVDGEVIYSARVGEQNNEAWIPFTAASNGPDTLMFENPLHDFPQCITYIKEVAGGWHVLVTGNEHGEERSEEFRFRHR